MGTLQDRIVLYPHMMAKNPQRGSGRIVGGNEAAPHSYPHLVFLLIDSLYVCGGNIFNENTIITAAHCADGARRVEITAGAHDQSVNNQHSKLLFQLHTSSTQTGTPSLFRVTSPSCTLTLLSSSPTKLVPLLLLRRSQQSASR